MSEFASVRFLAFAVGSAGISIAVALGAPALRHNADSLIPVFVSLCDWTPFYWGQDRFGMTLALLAAPIRDGFWNLVAQNALSTWLLLLGLFATARRLGDCLPEATALLTLLVLVLWPQPSVELLLLTTNQSYAPSLGLFGLALSAGTNRRFTVALVLGATAAWINAGVALLVLSVGVVGVLFRLSRQMGQVAVAVSIVGLLLHRLLQLTATHLVDVTHLASVPLSLVIPRLIGYWTATWQEVIGWVGLPLVCVYLARVAFGGRSYLIPATVVVGGVLLYGSLMALFLSGMPRHAAPGLPVLLAIALTGVWSHGISRWLRSGIVFVLTVATLVAVRPTTPDRLRTELRTRFGSTSVSAGIAFQVAAVTGDYWTVWPAVFSLRYLQHGTTGSSVLPVALRAERLQRQFARLGAGDTVLIVPPGDLSHWNLVPGHRRLEIVTHDTRFEIARLAP